MIKAPLEPSPTKDNQTLESKVAELTAKLTQEESNGTALETKITELTVELTQEKANTSTLRADLKRKTANHDLRITILRKIRKLAAEIGTSFGALPFSESDPDSSGDEVSNPPSKKIGQSKICQTKLKP